MPLSERSVLEDLTVRFREPLRRFFARRLSDSPDAEDLASEVFVRLLRHRESLAGIEHIEGYIFKIAWNVLRDRTRRMANRMAESTEGLDQLVDDHALAADRVLIGRENVEQLTAAIEELPDKTRMIFLLYHFESVSQVEIARRLLISLSSVEKHMARANATLLRRVGRLL